MARGTAAAVQVNEVDEFEGFEVDDIPGESAVGAPVVNVDDGFVDAPESTLTTTANFHGQPLVQSGPGVQDLGVIVVSPDESRRVQVTEDIGPVYYGTPGVHNEPIELKAGRTYLVEPHIYDYLHRRGKIVGQ